MKRLGVLVALFAFVLCSRTASAIDPWDAPRAPDDGSKTTSQKDPSRSTTRRRSVTADQDWYLIKQQAWSSYEVIVDGLTEDVAAPATATADALQVDLVDNASTLISSGYAFSSIGAARTLRFRNVTGSEVTNQYVRVMTGTNGCTTACTVNSNYRILVRDTTLLVPRFNNSGTQTTVLILQNASRDSVTITPRFWSAAGTLITSGANTTIPSHGAFVLATQTVAGAAGQSGTMTIDHTGRFGSITGKAVALEPSTGFTFDTVILPKFN